MNRVYVPNSFSPNNDGHNDLFHPVAFGFESVSYSIYNRWGEIIFSTPNNEAWDGTYQGSIVQDGIYMYLMETQEMNGGRHYYNGQIVVIR
jgi:gliding motility-associated-like protein